MAQAGQRQAGTERRSTVTYADMCRLFVYPIVLQYLTRIHSIDHTAISRVHVPARCVRPISDLFYAVEAEVHDRHSPSPDDIS